MRPPQARTRIALFALPTTFLVLALAGPGARPLAAAPAREPMHRDPNAQPGPAAAPVTNPRLKQLDEQLQALRNQFHAQLDPLQAQIKTLRDQFEPQIKSLEDERHTLVEQAKPDAVQQLDQREADELAKLDDQEKAAIDKVRQDFAEQKKQLREKYQGEIKEVLASKH
jgi:DNA anti-recombination protein RmuC